MSERKAKIRNCPKCGAVPEVYTEVGTCFTEWIIEDGVIERSRGIHDFGSINKMLARCSNLDCGYTWTLRGVTQIDEMLK